jgi:hypothetical protein
MDFEILGEITQIETIARSSGIRDRVRLQKHYGRGRWRKLKGVADVRLIDGSVRLAEIHWYEAGVMKMLPLALIRFLFRCHKAIKNRILRTWNKNRIGSERRFEGNFHQPSMKPTVSAGKNSNSNSHFSINYEKKRESTTAICVMPQ